MVKELKEYQYDYGVLFALLSVAAILYAYFRDNKAMEQLIALGMALIYVLWGIIHHHRADKVTAKIVLEYVLVAIFGLIVINSLLIWR